MAGVGGGGVQSPLPRNRDAAHLSPDFLPHSSLHTQKEEQDRLEKWCGEGDGGEGGGGKEFNKKVPPPPLLIMKKWVVGEGRRRSDR